MCVGRGGGGSGASGWRGEEMGGVLGVCRADEVTRYLLNV